MIRKIDADEVLLELRKDDILRILFKENSVLDNALQLKLLDLVNEICEGKKYGFLYEAMENVTITKEARENSKTLEHLSPHYASASIANTLPYQLISNFYLKFNKPKKPYKVFRKEKDAVEWLLEQKDKV